MQRNDNNMRQPSENLNLHPSISAQPMQNQNFVHLAQNQKTAYNNAQMQQQPNHNPAQLYNHPNHTHTPLPTHPNQNHPNHDQSQGQNPNQADEAGAATIPSLHASFFSTHSQSSSNGRQVRAKLGLAFSNT
jgi:hypothetical protein